MKRKINIRELIYISVCTALMAVCSWISIPMTVPFTLQTFAVTCILGIIGGKDGTLAILLYILLGAVGIPVFSGFTGGIGILFGSTGGYILGFIFMGIIYWIIEELAGESLYTQAVAAAFGLLSCYLFGTAWFVLGYSMENGAIGIGTALSWCVLPFVIPDIVKSVLAVLISERLRRIIRKNR